MMESLSKLLLAAFPGPVRLLATIAMTALILLTTRNGPFVAPLLKDSFWRWVIAALVLAVTGLGTFLMELIWKACAKGLKRRKHSKAIVKRLESLTQDEQHVLRHYLRDDRKTYNFGRGGGVVDLLTRDGILHLLTPAAVLTPILMDTYAINGTAWEHLRAFPELIELERIRTVTPPSP